MVRDAPHLGEGRRAEREERDRRLAEALRANLRRRKEQTRAREQNAAPPVKDCKTDGPRG
jgi:hypothetical protein